MESVKLAIENENNKLQCNAFVQIGPAPGTFRESSFDKLYCISTNNEDRFYKLVDFIRIDFKDIGSAFTIPASGFESVAWKFQYKRSHPEVNDDSKMAVYFFQKHQ